MIQQINAPATTCKNASMEVFCSPPAAQGLLQFMNRRTSRHFRLRPISEVATRLMEVSSAGHTGLDLLTLSFSHFCRVEMWRGGCRSDISVAAPFVWRCLSGSTVTPFPHPARRTGHAGLPHPALGQDLTPSPTARRDQVRSGVRAGSAHKGARVDKSRPCVA